MTTIHVDKETWKKLNTLKNPGESMNDVIRKILETFERNETKMTMKKFNPENFNKMLDEFCNIASEEIETVIEGTRKSFLKDRL